MDCRTNRRNIAAFSNFSIRLSVGGFPSLCEQNNNKSSTQRASNIRRRTGYHVYERLDNSGSNRPIDFSRACNLTSAWRCVLVRFLINYSLEVFLRFVNNGRCVDNYR